MPVDARNALDEAIDWHLRSASMKEDQWEAFASWLESSAENRFEYDRVARTDALLMQLPSTCREHAEATHEERRSLRPWVAGMAAAVAALAVIVAPQLAAPTQRIEQTAAGTVKQITFADGVKLDLNGETRLELAVSNARSVTLQSGEALFTVSHSERPFTVKAGGFTILDLGTVFNVALDEKTLQISVKDGSVLFDPDGAKLTVGAGETITVDRTHNVVVRGRTDGAGGWLSGDLSFENSTLDTVVAAINRRTGIDIRLTHDLSGTPFTGNIKVSGDGAADAAHLAKMIGANSRREGDAWVLERESVSR